MGNVASNSIEIVKIATNLRICATFFVSLFLFFIAFYITRKPVVTKRSKEYKNVISPILAEVLVDGKIDIKNLILTTIVELQIKKNIAIVDDNVIELLHKSNLNSHEIFLVDLIFQDKKVVTFNEINDRFNYAKFYETTFTDSMSKIALEIQTKLYKLKVFSRKRMLILNLASYIAMLILINFPTILLGEFNQNYLLYYMFAFLVTLIASMAFYTRLTGGDAKAIMDSAGQFAKSLSFYGIIIFAVIMIVLYFSIIPKLQINLFVILAIALVYLINYKTFKLAKNNVLSKKGFEERRKILELKNFLEGYDLRKAENGEFYILWNEYFAYAAAFGISNPIIENIYSSWKNLDITFYFTKNLI